MSLTRVTEAVGYFKTDWYLDWVLRVGKREANATSKKALAIGKRIDEIIRSGNYIADSKDSKEVKNCLNNFNAWRERYGVGTLLPLNRIEDAGIGITGEADFYWEDADTLIDFKSSKSISPEYIFQLGGYKRLGFKGIRIAILRCGKEENDFEFKTNEDYGLTIEQCVDAFEATYKHYKYYTHINAQIGEYNG